MEPTSVGSDSAVHYDQISHLSRPNTGHDLALCHTYLGGTSAAPSLLVSPAHLVPQRSVLECAPRDRRLHEAMTVAVAH